MVSSIASKNLQASLNVAMEDAFPYGIKRPSKMSLLPQGHTEHQSSLLEKTAEYAKKSRNDDSQTPHVHIGICGLFNFDLIAAGKPDYAIMADIFPGMQQILNNFVLPALSDAATPEEFQNKMLEHSDLLTEFTNYDPDTLKNMPWMKPENYSILHEMAQKGNILTTSLDIYDEEGCKALKHFVEKQGWHVSTLYASNVLEHALENNQRANIDKNTILDLQKMTSREEQDKRIYIHGEEGVFNSDYQSHIPDDFVTKFYKNIDTLMDKNTVAFMTAEIPYANVSCPQVIIEGKLDTPSPQKSRGQ